MIPETQRQALAVLAQLCDLSSDDMRLGQLVAWIGDLGEYQAGKNLPDIEDEDLLAALMYHRDQLLARLPESQQQTYRSSFACLPIASNPVVPESSRPADVGR